MQQQFALGVEGGGTKTEWVLLSLPGKIVVRSGSLPPANFKLITHDALERILKLLPGHAAHAGVYLAAADAFDLAPRECMMVAAHSSDLKAAAKLGFATAHIARPNESGPGLGEVSPTVPVDVAANDLGDLASQLGT